MGLDMYLQRMPRYRGATANDVEDVEDYLAWIMEKTKGTKYSNCTFEEWCGKTKTPRKSYLEFYAKFYKAHYSDWDTEHRCPWMRITEEVGYWRKENAIHKWFVENVQNGVDDCYYHTEVTREHLDELRDVCHQVLCNPDLASSLLSTQGGFFFGDTVYDEYYFNGLRNTINIIDKILETTDFDTQMIYYRSSW